MKTYPTTVGNNCSQLQYKQAAAAANEMLRKERDLR